MGEIPSGAGEPVAPTELPEKATVDANAPEDLKHGTWVVDSREPLTEDEYAKQQAKEKETADASRPGWVVPPAPEKKPPNWVVPEEGAETEKS